MVKSLRGFVLFGVTALSLCLLARQADARSLPPGDTIRRFNPQLVLLLTDTSEEAQRQRTQLFYDKLKNRFYRRDFTRRLYDLLIDETPYDRPAPRPSSSGAMEYFQQFEGKVVQEVRINKLPVFGGNVNDTTQKSSNWLKQIGNAAHFQTRDWVIRKNLLFQEGDFVEPEMLYDNERLLRNLSYIRDARIRLITLPDNPDAVVVEVITQDVFPLSVSAGKSSFSSYSVAVQNNNIFGIGHRLISEGLFRSNGTPSLGYAGTYMVENVNGTFINASVSGAYNSLRRGAGVSVQRLFFTPDIRWAGGLDLQRMEQFSAVLYRNPEQDTVAWYTNDWLDVWLGHSIPLNVKRPHPKGREALVFTGRGVRVFHHDVPGGEVMANDFFLNRKLFLGSTGWVRRRYRRDAFIYGFGRTEDVPMGALFNITAGLEQQEDEELMYYGQVNAGWGSYIERLGYLDLRAAFGQYLGDGGGAKRRLRAGSINWISPLMPSGKYKFRQLISVDYLYGDRRLNHEFISVGDREIRGISGQAYRGSQRFNASFETIMFTPLQMVGFRLAGFVFAEIAMLNNDPYLSLEGHVFQGYGAGIRVRNENLVFKTFQLRVSYHPVHGGGFSMSILGSPNKIFQDFLIGKPQAHPFH